MKTVTPLYLLASSINLTLLGAWLWWGLELEINQYLAGWFAPSHAAVAFTLSIMLWCLPGFLCWKYANRLAEKHLSDSTHNY